MSYSVQKDKYNTKINLLGRSAVSPSAQYPTVKIGNQIWM